MHPITNPGQIGGILASRRKHLKLTQAELALRLGLSQNRLSELEAHPETLSAEQLLALLNLLGLEMAIAQRTGGERGKQTKIEW